jgi:hypothetical protein
MQWFRSNSFGSWCALFALAVQLVLSFGHVHRGGTLRPVAFSFAAVTASGQSAAAMSAAVPGVPRPADIGFDYCGICTIINLANAIVPPATPALPPPSVESGIGHWANFEFASALLHHVIFEARAPPQA